jgi:hypothetical protein
MESYICFAGLQALIELGNSSVACSNSNEVDLQGRSNDVARSQTRFQLRAVKN